MISAKRDLASTDAQHGIWVNLTGNDTDSVAGYVPHVVSTDSTGTRGTASLVAGATTGVSYAPNHAFDYLSAGQTATDTFSYTVADSGGATSTATATVTVTGVNQAPTARPDTAQTDAQHGVWVNLTRNDSDVNKGDTLTVASLPAGGTLGSVVMNPQALNGAWYVPGPAFAYLGAGETATDRFSYTIADGHGGTDTDFATVTVVGVNAAPVATPIAASTDAGRGTWLDALATVRDQNVHDTLRVTAIDTSRTLGTVTWKQGVDNGFWYSPGHAFDGLAAGQTATDSFTYTVSDGHGGTTTNTATVTVDGAARAATPAAYYVATDGNDNWSGRLARPNAAGTDGPLKTLNAAHWRLENNPTTHTVYIEGGTYTPANPLNLLARDNGETWTAYDGQKVVIDGSHQSRVFCAVGAHDITISGLTILGGAATYAAIQSSNSSNIRIENVIIDGGTNGILIGSGGSNVHVLDNQIRNASSVGVMITPGTNDVTVDGNYIHDIGVAAAGIGVWFTGSSDDVFSNNLVENTGKVGIGGGSTVGKSDASYNALITHNTVRHANMVNADAGGINLVNEQQDDSGLTVSYNTVSDTSAGNPNAWIGPGIYMDDFTSGATVHGNLLQNNLDGVFVHLGWNNAIDGNVVTGSTIAFVMSGEQNNGRVPLQAPANNVFSGNTAYLDDVGAIVARSADAVGGAEWTNNLYGGPAMGGAAPFIVDNNHQTVGYSAAQWVGMGNDAGSQMPLGGLTMAQALATLPAG